MVEHPSALHRPRPRPRGVDARDSVFADSTIALPRSITSPDAARGWKRSDSEAYQSIHAARASAQPVAHGRATTIPGKPTSHWLPLALRPTPLANRPNCALPKGTTVPTAWPLSISSADALLSATSSSARSRCCLRQTPATGPRLPLRRPLPIGWRPWLIGRTPSANRGRTQCILHYWHDRVHRVARVHLHARVS